MTTGKTDRDGRAATPSPAKAQRSAASGLLCAVALMLSSCNAGQTGEPFSNDVYNAVAGLDLSARFGGSVQPGDASRPTTRSRGISYVGSAAEPSASSPRGTAAGGDGGYEVDFDAASIADVAKAIIVDALKLPLVIDPRVDGRITLSSGRALRRNELLAALEGALKANNALLIKDGAGYRIAPGTEGGINVGVERGRDPTPGFGVSVLPLRYVSGENILKLVDSFAVKPGSVRVDTSRNLLLVQGSSDERKAAIDTALSFDQDFMRGQSVGVYPVVNAAPETLISELQRIMDSGEGGVGKGVVQFQSIARMNAILVVSRSMPALRTAQTWIQRLDRSDNSASMSKVYRVKYGNARQLASLLNEALGNGAASAGLQSDPFEPGAGKVSLASAGGQGGGQNAAGGGNLASAGGASGVGGGSNPFGSLFGRNGQQQQAGSFSQGGGQDGVQSARLQTPDLQAARGGGSTRFRVTADNSTNSLLIVADRETFRMIERVLQQLDRPRLQVAIEATIAEVSLNDGLQYGVQYFLKSGDLNGVRADRGSAGFTQTANAVLGRVLPGFNFLLGPQTDPRLILDALSSRTNVKVLSTPSVVVQDNQVASIQVGDQVPVATTQATLVGPTSTGLLSNPAFPVANNIDYRNTGVILRVLPRVSAQGNVSLEVEQEISNVSQNGSQGSLTPTVSQRHIKSSIAVTSGQTVVLAGLISNRETGDRSGMPILSNFAFIGDLFAHNQTIKNRTELIVFIRPQIIADGIDAQAVAEDMRAKMLLSGGLRH